MVIVLDLSQPTTCLPALSTWLHKVHDFAANHHSTLSAVESASQKSALIKYLKNARVKKGTVNECADEDSNELPIENNTEESFISEYFGIPIVVVGNKSDTIVADSSVAMKQARELQGRIRSICFEIGAALVYTSSDHAEKTNCSELKKYIAHRLYPNQISMELSLVVSAFCFCFFE